MSLIALDHVNIRTRRLDALVRFYTEVVGLRAGPRPPFRFGGAWLYCGDTAVLHLVEADADRDAPSPGIEHFALRARGLAGVLARVRSRGLAYRIGVVPGWQLRQLHIADPDGNHVELGFPADEPLPEELCAPAGTRR